MEEGADMPADQTDQILYHYCGVSAFRGIVTSRVFRLSNVRFMSDPTEQEWLIDKARRKIEERSKATPHDRGGLERLTIMLGGPNVPCAFCLSSERDSRSHWHEFSDDGAGFAIGFSRVGIEAACDDHYRRTGEAIAVRRIEYVEAEQDRLVNDCLDAHSDDRAAGNTMATERMSAARASIRVCVLGAVCKDPEYSAEKESRIVWFPPLKDIGAYDTSSIVFPPGGTPYFPLSFGRDAIKQVWLGPKNGEREDHPVVGRFLRQNGYGIGLDAIKNSEVAWP
jgi:hypothetical protein